MWIIVYFARLFKRKVFCILLSEYKMVRECKYKDTLVRWLLFLLCYLILLNNVCLEGRICKLFKENFQERMIPERPWEGLVRPLNSWEMWAWTWDLYWLWVCINCVYLLLETVRCRRVHVKLCFGPQGGKGEGLDKKRRCASAEPLGILSLTNGFLCLVLGRRLGNICWKRKWLEILLHLNIWICFGIALPSVM